MVTGEVRADGRMMEKDACGSCNFIHEAVHY